MVGVTVSRVCAGCETGLAAVLRGCCCTPYQKQVVLLSYWSRSPECQTLLPLSACPASKEVIAEANEVCAVSEDLWTTCVGVGSSAQKQPQGHVPFFVLFVPDLVQSCDVELPGVRAWGIVATEVEVVQLLRSGLLLCQGTLTRRAAAYSWLCWPRPLHPNHTSGSPYCLCIVRLSLLPGPVCPRFSAYWWHQNTC